MTNAPDLEDRIRQIEWPEPTDGLRARVVSSPVPASRVSWSDRVWFSRASRLGAASLLAGAVAVELWMGVPGATRVGPAPQAIAEARALDEAGQDLGIPEGLVFALAERWLTDPPLRRFDLEGVLQ